MEAQLKDFLPLAIAAGLMLPAFPATAQDFAAGPGKTRVTLYFEGSAPTLRPEPAASLAVNRRVPPLAPAAKPRPEPLVLEEAPASQDGAVHRTVRYMTAAEWAVHPANPARQAPGGQ